MTELLEGDVPDPRSRVYRQVVTIEVIALAGPDVEVRGDLLGGHDIEGMVRATLHSRDVEAGQAWLVAGESSVTKIEELTP